MAEPPIKLGPYSLIRKIGRGAFGVVWLAEKRTTIATTQFALKLAHNEDIDLDAFKQEAAIWVKASGHPNVVSLIEADVYDDQVALVSEYLPDGSLAAWLREHGGKASSIESACDIIDGVLSGLGHLHDQRIIHRDLKPDNILLRHEIPHLADFGIARFLQTDSYSTNISGTLAYMAPEAFDGKRNERTDLWSAGVILYQLLAGRLPYSQPDMVSMIGALMRYEPPPLPDSTPGSLRRIVRKALKREPSQRYASAKEMRKDLRTARQSLSINEREPDTTTTEQETDHFIPPTVFSAEPPSSAEPIETITAVYPQVHSGPDRSPKLETPQRHSLLRLSQQTVLLPVVVWGIVGFVSGLLSELGFNLRKGDIHTLFPGLVFGVALFAFGEVSSSPSLGKRNRVLSLVILVAFSTLGWFLALRIVFVFNRVYFLDVPLWVQVSSFVIAGLLGGLLIVVGEMLCWRKTLGRWQLLLYIIGIAAVSGAIAHLVSDGNFYLLFASWQMLVLSAHAVAHSRNKIWLFSSIAVVITLAIALFILNSLIKEVVSASTKVQNVNATSTSTPTPTPIPTPDKAQLQIAVDDYLARVATKTSGDETDKTLRKTVYGDIDGDGDEDAVVQFVLDAKEGNSSGVLLAVFINTDGKFKGANAEYVGGNHLRDFELDSVQAGSITGTTLECNGDSFPCENEMKRQATIVWKDNKMEVPSRWIR